MKTFYSGGDKLSKELKNFYGDEINYSTIMKLFRKKDVKLNGKRVGGDIQTAPHDLIEAYFDGTVRPIREIYKDENVLVVYKPDGISSEEFFAKIQGAYKAAAFIHRLDRNTDGIMIFALSPAAETELLKGFKDRTFDKYYLAEVFGTPKADRATMTAYLKKDAEKALVKISDKPAPSYEKIVTEYEVLKRTAETAVLKVKLVTGKTHQIRAHLAFLNLPIIGDGKYGNEKINRKFKAKTQRLTAKSLTLHFDENSPLFYLDGKTFCCEEGVKRLIKTYNI